MSVTIDARHNFFHAQILGNTANVSKLMIAMKKPLTSEI